MALHKNLKIELIKGIPLFAQCSKAELANVAAIADEVHMPEGKTLMKEGEPGLEFFVLVDGTVAVYQGKQKVNELSDGDFFGEVAVIAGTPRTATVMTTAPSRLLVVTARELTRLLRDSPGIQLKVLQALAQRVAPSTI